LPIQKEIADTSVLTSQAGKRARKTGWKEYANPTRYYQANGWLLRISRQILDTAETRIIPKRLFPPRLPDKNRFTSSCPGAVMTAPISV
jgi:hypothetical protein